MKNLLLCLIAIIAVTACTAEKVMEQERSLMLKTRSVASLEVDAQFLKLKDDTASFVAGELEIDAPGNEVAVKWNVLPGCNLDTTVVSLPVENGKAHLPIKWNNSLRSRHHGPDSLAFEAGVIISTEDKAKYVRLLWADAIDSLYFAQNPVVMDTPQAPYPEPKTFTVSPLVLDLDEVLGGSILVSGTGKGSNVILTEVTADLNIDKESIISNPIAPGVIQNDNYLEFKWTAAGPPLFSFTKPISVENDGKTIVAHIVYKHRDVPPPFYQLISALPDTRGYISATNGYVMVAVETNKTWSIISNASDEVIEDTDESGLKTRTRMIHILDNPNPDLRLVQLIIKSQGIAKDTIEVYQLGTKPLINLGYLRDNMPTPLPKEGGEYTFTFTGVNQGTVQIQALVDGVPISVGTAVIGLEAKITIPENPNETDRNVTFQYRVTDEEWMPFPAQTNRVQLGTNGGEVDVLTYLDSNLPVGNIPQLGDTYSFNFKGTYKGRLRVRASVDGTWYTGDMSSTLSASVNIPANNTPNVLPVKFQYRAFDAVPSQWIYFPDETKRNQDALTNTGTLTPGDLAPADEIIEWGETASCTFGGTYAGFVYMQAVVDGVVLAGPVRGKVGEKLALDIPQLKGLNRVISFQYKKEGEEWQTFTERAQKNQVFTLGSSLPNRDFIAEGEPYKITFSGTYTKKITLIAEIEDGGGLGGKVEIVRETSNIYPKHEFNLMIPPNLSNSPRGIGIVFIREDLPDKKYLVEVKVQSGKK